MTTQRNAKTNTTARKPASKPLKLATVYRRLEKARERVRDLDTLRYELEAEIAADNAADGK